MRLADTHSKKGIIPFERGVSLMDLMDFYNQPDFKGGKPVYNSHNPILGSNLEMLDAGVVFLSVPNYVQRHLDPSGSENLEKIGIATDALITLASIDNLGNLTEREFYKAAIKKTIGSRTDYYQYVDTYLTLFTQLLMTKTNNPDTLSIQNFKPNKSILAQYTAVGIVPAPLMDYDGKIDRKRISLNIPHQVCFTGSVGRIEYASPDSVKRLYAPFVKQD